MLLPDEIWEQILQYLDTFELMQFCSAFPNLEYFLKNARLINTINFARKFEAFNTNVCHFITSKVDYEAVKTLKVDGLYWIPADDLRRLVHKMKNLKELCAVDTNLGLHDSYLYTNLTKLSLTVDIRYFEAGRLAKNIPNVKCLFLKLIQIPGGLWMEEVALPFAKLNQLEELWLSDESSQQVNWRSVVEASPNLKKFVCKSNAFLMYDKVLSELGLYLVFDRKRGNDCCVSQFICERDKIIEENKQLNLCPNDIPKRAWDTFVSLRQIPCGYRECKQMYLNHNIDINFVELNFCPICIQCTTKHNDCYTYTEAAREVLLSGRCTFLKRLCFRTCFLFKYEMSHTFQISKRKKPRTEMQTDEHSFCQITEKLKSLRELEIYYCSTCGSNKSIAGGYISIAKLANLEKLSLDIPKFLDGSFLENTLKACSKLYSLSIKCLAPNEKFINNLYKSLKYATALRDFRLVYKEIAIDTLFESLNVIKQNNLQRIFLSCRNIKYDSNKSESQVYEQFFHRHTQLIFFFIVAYKHTRQQNADIQNILDVYKADSPAKFFLIHNNSQLPQTKISLPTTHYDLVLHKSGGQVLGKSNVSTIHFDEF